MTFFTAGRSQTLAHHGTRDIMPRTIGAVRADAGSPAAFAFALGRLARRVSGPRQPHRPLRRHRQDRRRRNGRGISRHRLQARSRRRDQGPSRERCWRRRPAGAVRARSQGRGGALASQHPRHSRFRRDRRNHLRGHGAARRRDAQTSTRERRGANTQRPSTSPSRSRAAWRPHTTRGSFIATSNPKMCFSLATGT